MTSVLGRLNAIWWVRGAITYKTADAHQIRVSLSARGTLHFESVEVGVFFRIDREEVGDPGRALEAVINDCGQSGHTPSSLLLGPR